MPTLHRYEDAPALREHIDAALAQYLDEVNLPRSLRDAAAYAVLAPGKRMRPILTIMATELLGGSIDDALPSACALEMVHAFSLVHDDLPALDNDELRRGRPTVHVQHGEAMAILVGDLLNTLPFRLLSDRTPDAARVGALCVELSEATCDMIAGQVYDTLGGFPQSLTDEERLRLTHRLKTGALIRCACRMGARAAGASADDLESITAYGEAVGLVFQIVDDVLDVTQTTEAMGKRTQKDEQADKLTYPGVLGLEASRREIRRLTQLAEDALTPYGDRADPLRELCASMAVRTH
jgi:geranylgeranyl diphosphate synthase type II